MKVAVWITVISTCLVGVTVDSAILRDYRANAKLAPGSVLLDPEKNSKERNQRTRIRKKTFRPTSNRCCKIGHKVSKRQLSCDISVLEVVRKYNDLQRAKMKYNRPRKIRPSKISAKFSTKLGKCIASFPQIFEKCCKQKDQYFERLEKCKKKSRKERRKCRQYIRGRFKKPKKKGGKKQKRSKKARRRKA